MERRVLFAIVLCFATLYLWQTYVVKPTLKPAADAAKSSSQTAALASSSSAPASSPALLAAEKALVESASVGDSQERDVRVETRDFIAVFTNRGARLKSWR